MSPYKSTPTPYQHRTCAASSSDFVTKSEDALEEVRRWYDDGTAQVGRLGISKKKRRVPDGLSPCEKLWFTWLGGLSATLLEGFYSRYVPYL